MRYAYLLSQLQGLYVNNIDVMGERERVCCILRGIMTFLLLILSWRVEYNIDNMSLYMK